MKYNMLEHAEMAEMKAKHPGWIWNRSDTHVILGVPQSHEAFKTIVEPGNSFSPGAGSYGVSTWIYTSGKLHTPEQKLYSEMEWSYEDGHIPVLNSKWNAGAIQLKSSLFTDGDISESNIKDYFTIELTNTSDAAAECSFYLVIRSFGAAGGPLKKLESKGDGRIFVNGSPMIYYGKAPTAFGAVSYADTGKDISEYLKDGHMPAEMEICDESTWASGALEYKVKLQPGERVKYDFIFQLKTDHPMLGWIKPIESFPDLDKIRADFIKRWKEVFPMRLNLPDKRFTDAFFCQVSQLYMFTVDTAPRISPISYPLWWLRDGAYVVIALSKAGLNGFVDQVCRNVAPRDAFGGFGCEGDGPGEVIWILSEHYLLTRDKEYLKEVFPHIKRKAELLMKMRRTTKPMKMFNEFCIPQMMLDPTNDLLCLPAKDGLITGRMDLHFPIIWINAFAYLGLKRAAFCAKELGMDASMFEEEAEDLKVALRRKAEEIFGQNDRDVNCAFWPASWASRDDEFILKKFDEFWDTVRCPGGVHNPEPLWTYFEAGQAHNYMMCGQRERAWVSLEMFLSKHTAQGLYTYSEGERDENSSQLWQRTRGWDDINYVTPHGWTAAELFLVLRDCLMREENGTLVIGSGVPAEWMKSSFAVENMPTYFGLASFWYTSEDKKLKVKVERMPEGGIISELPGEVSLEIIK